MKYKYYDQRGRLLCESDSPVTFNLVLYPMWKYIKCVIDEGESTVVAERITQTENDRKAEKSEEADRPKSKKKKKKTEEDYS